LPSATAGRSSAHRPSDYPANTATLDAVFGQIGWRHSLASAFPLPSFAACPTGRKNGLALGFIGRLSTGVFCLSDGAGLRSGFKIGFTGSGSGSFRGSSLYGVLFLVCLLRGLSLGDPCIASGNDRCPSLLSLDHCGVFGGSLGALQQSLLRFAGRAQPI